MDFRWVLIVHQDSYWYLKSIVEHLRQVLAGASGGTLVYQLARSAEEVSLEPGSLVFTVGDPLGRFPRTQGCYYIFLNFSVLYLLGSPLAASLEGWSWIRHKRMAFLERVPSYDAVLDFYPSHTAVLKRRLARSPLLVESFPIHVPDDGVASSRWEERPYDICVVGTETKRRNAVYSQLRQRGLILSPLESSDLRETMRHSRIVLNVHACRANTLELPRLVEAFSVGSCVITEKCFELEKYFPASCYYQVEYRDLVKACVSLLENEAWMEGMGQAARSYMREQHADASEAAWARLLTKIQQAARKKSLDGRPSTEA